MSTFLLRAIVNDLERQPLDDKHMSAALLLAQSLRLHRTLQWDVHNHFLLEVIRSHAEEML